MNLVSYIVVKLPSKGWLSVTEGKKIVRAKQSQLMELVKEFKANAGEANGLDYLAIAFEFAVTEDVSITPIVNAWKENKDSIAKDGSVDRFFEFLCKVIRITDDNCSGSNRPLWDTKESTISSGLELSEESKKLLATAVAREKTHAELREERKDTSSWFTPGWPCWELFEEGFAEVGNPIQVIGTLINGLYQENYRDDPDICFHATDKRYLLTTAEKRFLSSITEDLIELRKADPISDLLKIVVFGRCAAEDRYYSHPKYWIPDETDWREAANELNNWIHVAGQSSQPVFLSILYTVLEFGENQFGGELEKDGLEFLLECNVGRWAPPAIPIEALPILIATCDLVDVSAETLIPLYDQILDAQKELASDGRCLFTVTDAAMIYDFTSYSELSERLPAAVLLAQLQSFFGNGLNMWNENLEPPEFDSEYRLLIKACIRDRLYSLAQALMAFWMVAGALRSEAEITSWQSKVELITELRDKPGFPMVQRSLMLLYSHAKEVENSFTTALLDVYVDKQAVEEEIEKPKWERHVTNIYPETPLALIEDKVKETLGDTFDVLQPKSKQILVDAHKKLFKLQPEMQFGTIKNWGNIGAEFIKLFEIELEEKLRDVYQDQRYREFKVRRKEPHTKKPSLGHYLHMLKDHKHLEKSLQEEIELRVSLQHDRDTIRELERIYSRYRNPGFHTDVVPAAKVLEVTEILYGEKALISRFMQGMSSKARNIK